MNEYIQRIKQSQFYVETTNFFDELFEKHIDYKRDFHASKIFDKLRFDMKKLKNHDVLKHYNYELNHYSDTLCITPKKKNKEEYGVNFSFALDKRQNAYTFDIKNIFIKKDIKKGIILLTVEKEESHIEFFELQSDISRYRLCLSHNSKSMQHYNELESLYPKRSEKLNLDDIVNHINDNVTKNYGKLIRENNHDAAEKFFTLFENHLFSQKNRNEEKEFFELFADIQIKFSQTLRYDMNPFLTHFCAIKPEEKNLKIEKKP